MIIKEKNVETNANHTQPKHEKCPAAKSLFKASFWVSVFVFKKLQLSAYLDVWLRGFGFETKDVANLR